MHRGRSARANLFQGQGARRHVVAAHVRGGAAQRVALALRMEKTIAHTPNSAALAAAAAAAVEIGDIMDTMMRHVKAVELRRAAQLGQAWRAAVERERTRRLALPRTQ